MVIDTGSYRGQSCNTSMANLSQLCPVLHSNLTREKSTLHKGTKLGYFQRSDPDFDLVDAGPVTKKSLLISMNHHAA